MAKAKRRAKKASRKSSKRRKTSGRKAKGHIPLKILEKRQKRLTSIVKARGGKVSS